jgi:hypothetical protein
VLLFEYDREKEEVAEKWLLPATNQKVARSSRAGRINEINRLASRQLAAFCLMHTLMTTFDLFLARF